jgi:hypothetical protein
MKQASNAETSKDGFPPVLALPAFGHIAGRLVDAPTFLLQTGTT